jgi:hypothetical protein
MQVKDGSIVIGVDGHGQPTGLLHHDTDAEIETNITATTASTINSHPSWTDKRGSGHPLRVSRGGGSSRRCFRPRRGTHNPSEE